MGTKKLNRCPFCGSRVKIDNIAENNDDEYYMVQCENEDCGASSCFGEGTKKEIIERWNRRAGKCAKKRN